MAYPTYSLYDEHGKTASYYEASGRFADSFLEQAAAYMPQIHSFMEFILSHNKETLRTDVEYLLEMVTLGVFWRKYASRALCLSSFKAKTLIRLTRFRKKGLLQKFTADFLRGIFLTAWLHPHIKKTAIRKSSADALLLFLSSAGDYEQEVKRLRNWAEYMHDSHEESNILWEASVLADLLLRTGEKLLKPYLQNLNFFLKSEPETHRFKEDLLFCGREQEEYYLNMFGAEILNRAYHHDFMARERKALMLPACMRAKDEKHCKSIISSLGYSCTSCDKDCAVNRLTKKGKILGLEVYIIPHESSLFAEGTEKENVRNKLGVIGVACVLNLLSGGWKVKGLGIPAQCVLLNYCGCKNHWDKQGIRTDIADEQLEKIMSI